MMQRRAGKLQAETQQDASLPLCDPDRIGRVDLRTAFIPVKYANW